MGTLNRYRRLSMRTGGLYLILVLLQLNILVNNDNRAVITDFGSARAIILSHKTEEKPLTPTGSPNPTEVSKVESLAAEVSAEGGSITLTGPAWTIRWAAPELLNGSETSLTSDVWAFGWVCWEVRAFVLHVRRSFKRPPPR